MTKQIEVTVSGPHEGISTLADKYHIIPDENGIIIHSPKIMADFYLDDKSINPEDWEKVVEQVEASTITRQPVSPSVGYEGLVELGERALPEFTELLAKLNMPIVHLDQLEGKLSQPGGLVVLAPLKAEERSTEKVESDYDGDWSRLLDMVRASVAVDSMGELQEAVQALEGAGAQWARNAKNRFDKPRSSGYRDYLTNVRLPCGAVAEVQFHLKPILAILEKEKLIYDIVRTIKAAMNNENRDSMTKEEVAIFQQAQNASQRMFNRAWEQATGKRNEKQLPLGPLPQPPEEPKPSPYSRMWHKWLQNYLRKQVTGQFVDITGRRYCYAGGRKVACNTQEQEKPQTVSHQPSLFGPSSPLPQSPPAQDDHTLPDIEVGPQATTFYALILNTQGQLLLKPDDPLGGLVWPVPLKGKNGSTKEVGSQLGKTTGLVLKPSGKIGIPETGQGYFLYTAEVVGESTDWHSPDQVRDVIKQSQNPQWRRRGQQVLSAALRRWHKPRETAKVSNSPFRHTLPVQPTYQVSSRKAVLATKAIQPSFTGTLQDSRGRRRCFRDGKNAPCEEFGGRGEGWESQRTHEDLYDAARRLMDKVKTGTEQGDAELIALLATATPEELKKLKRDHDLHVTAEKREELTQATRWTLQKLGYTISQGQQDQTKALVQTKEDEPTDPKRPAQKQPTPPPTNQPAPTPMPPSPSSPPSSEARHKQPPPVHEQPVLVQDRPETIALAQKPTKRQQRKQPPPVEEVQERTQEPEREITKGKTNRGDVLQDLEQNLLGNLHAAPEDFNSAEQFAKFITKIYSQRAVEQGASERDTMAVEIRAYQAALKEWEKQIAPRIEKIRKEALRYRKDPIEPDKPIQERIKSYQHGSSLGNAIGETLRQHSNQLNELQEAVNRAQAEYDRVATTLLGHENILEGPREILEEAKAQQQEAENTLIEAGHQVLAKHLNSGAQWMATASKEVNSDTRREAVAKGLEFVRSILSYGDQGDLDGGTVGVHSLNPQENQRARYDQGWGMYLEDQGKTSVATFVHEFGHHLEYEVPGIMEAAQEFLRYRVGNEEPARLKDLYPQRNYELWEQGCQDDFTKAFGDQAHYVGKIYDRGETEIIAMGLEALYKDPHGFASSDPDYFNFIIGICDGSLRKPAKQYKFLR